MIYGKSGNQLTSIYDHMGGIAPSAYNKNGEQVFPDSTGISHGLMLSGYALGTA